MRHVWLWFGLLGALLVVLGFSPVAAQPRGSVYPVPGLNDPSARNVAAAPSGCPPAWGLVPSPNVGSGHNELWSVTALASSDVWAVGSYRLGGTTDQTLALHWDGVSWTAVSSPNPSAAGSAFYAVGGTSANDVWAAGVNYSSTIPPETLIEHWNGSQWSVVSSPNPGNDGHFLNSLLALAPNNAWLVGGYSDNGGYEHTLILHWDGSVWSVVTSANAGTRSNVLDGIAGAAANDLWAVGKYDSVSSGPSILHTLVEHWNGAQWSVVSSPNVGPNDNALQAVAVVSPEDAWAVGTSCANSGPCASPQGLIEHWDGTTWSVVPSPNPGSLVWLTGVAALSASDIWATGFYDGGSGQQTLALHWNGTAWTVAPSPNVGPTVNRLRSSIAAGAGTVWAVGGYETGSGLSQTLTEVYPGPCGPATPTATFTPGTPTSTRTVTPTFTPTPTRTGTPPTATWTFTPTRTGTPPSLTPTSGIPPTNTPFRSPTGTPTGSACTVTISGSTPACSWPATYTYTFGFYTACTTSLSGASTVVFEVALTTSGPFTPYDQQSFSQAFPPGSSNAYGGFTENNIPPQYGAYRFHYTSQVSNGQLLDTYTLAQPLCLQQFVTPTPTGITTRCQVYGSGAQSTCFPDGNYGYDFGVYVACGTSLPASGTVLFEVAPASSGPWSTYRQQTVQGTYPPGAQSITGNFAVGGVPPPNQWYRLTLNILFAGGHNVSEQTLPALLCGPIPDPTPPGPTPDPTPPGPTPDPTPSALCDVFPAGTTASCASPGTYSYSFGYYIYCGHALTATGTTTLQVAPLPGGPWIDYMQQSFNTTLPGGSPGSGEIAGSFTAPNIPAPNAYYRISMSGLVSNGQSISGVTGVYPLCGSGTPTVTPTITPTVSATACALQFTDVPAGNPFYAYVRCLVCRNILSGYSGSPPCVAGAPPCFQPGASVTRGQAAKIISNAGGYAEAIPSGTQTFEDVPPANAFRVYIERLALPGRGYISGYTCGQAPAGPCVSPANRPYFLPGTSVTRGQLAKIDANAAGLTTAVPTTQQTFEDVSPANAFWIYIERLAPLQVISGYQCGQPPAGPCLPPGSRPYFLWANPVTRGQAAKIVANTFFPACATPAR